MSHGFTWRRKAACVGVLMCSLLHGASVPFDTSRPYRAPHISVLSSSNNAVSLRTTCNSATLTEVDTRRTTDRGTEIFSLLSLGQFTHTTEIGKPKLPVMTAVLDVPHRAQIAVRVVDVEVEEIALTEIGIDRRIMPALESVSKSADGPAHFVIDEEMYAQNTYYPTKVFEIEEYEGYARGHRLATLRVFPVHYNPSAGKIRAYTSITLEIDFIDADIATTKNAIAEHYSHVWEEYIRSMVVNYPQYLKGVTPLPVYYDIMYNGAFSAAAESLAYWKAKKGYKVRMWDAAGWSAQQINDTIEAQVPCATFLVIMGDPNASTPLPPSGTGSSTYDQTDLYYAETDGSGYLPDLYNARIAVLDATQAHTVVEKAIRYEHADFGAAGFDWLKKACFIAGYDPYGYQATGMATNWYCRNLLVAHGYQVDTLVYHYGEQEARVVNQINAGRAWCVYTAHGGRTEWWVGYSSDFDVSELTNQTNNLDMYPMPCGHCCLAADYQYSLSCFGETWDRLSGKGGICYFGSVPSTMWTEDDWLQRRYFDAIYADSVPGNLYETGRFTQWALYWINNNTGTSRKRYYFEAYHIFNDPSLDFWTDIPGDLDVVHDPVVVPGAQSCTVTVHDNSTPLENALVCCWIPDQSPDMHVAQYTDASGTAVLSITPQNQGDTMYVTATKHNYIPYEGYATVGADIPAAPFIASAEKASDDVILMWHPVITDEYGNPVDTDYYVIYRSVSPTFIPSNSDSIGSVAHPDTTFTDHDALIAPHSYYYLIKAVDESQNRSKPSNMAYALQRFFNENAHATDKNWVSLPYDNSYTTVSDLTTDVSPAGDPLIKITYLRDDQAYESWIWDPGFSQWQGTDFTIWPDRAYEMITIGDTTLPFVGCNDPDGLVFLNTNISPPATDKNWVPIPYNSAYDVISDIATEYSQTGDPLIKMTNLRDDQLYESYLWDSDFGVWVGNDFPIEVGRGYEFTSRADTFWNPTEYDNERTEKKTPLVESGSNGIPEIHMHCGWARKPERSPTWIQQADQYVRAGSPTSTYRTPGISHIVRLRCAAGEYNDFLFTVYRPHMPYDAITENTVGSGIATNGRHTVLWFDVGNFMTPWHDGDEILITVEASKENNNYYNVQTVTLNPWVNTQDIGTILLEPFPQPVSVDGMLHWDPARSNSVVGYSIYRDGERLNTEVLTGNSYTGSDGCVRLVLRGGHESVKASQRPHFEHEGLPHVSTFSFSPNPFMQQTEITYQVSEPARVVLQVYDAAGRLVKNFVETTLDPGYYTVTWDARDGTGRELSTGVYFMTFTVRSREGRDCAIVKKAVFVGK